LWAWVVIRGFDKVIGPRDYSDEPIVLYCKGHCALSRPQYRMRLFWGCDRHIGLGHHFHGHSHDGLGTAGCIVTFSNSTLDGNRSPIISGLERQVASDLVRSGSSVEKGVLSKSIRTSNTILI